MTVWAVLDKDGRLLALLSQEATARKLAESIPDGSVEEMTVLHG